MERSTKTVRISKKHRFTRGHKKLGGRRKGSQNKITRIAKEIYQAAFEGSGGLPALIAWIKKSNANRREFYKLHARLLPLDIQSDEEEQLSYEIVIGNMRDSEIEREVAKAELNEFFDEYGHTKAGQAIKELIEKHNEQDQGKNILQVNVRHSEKESNDVTETANATHELKQLPKPKPVNEMEKLAEIEKEIHRIIDTPKPKTLDSSESSCN
ncbi:MAG: hypothetical protein ABR936_05240 [Bacteroidota bacterium]|jgi:hypothetical protein